MKIRVNTSYKIDKAIAGTQDNNFVIPNDLEMLESTIPCYKVALVNTVCYEITFNNYERFI